MIYGKTYTEQLEPRLIFAFIPRRLQDGRKIWWDYVWKCFDNTYDVTYVLTWDEAKLYPGSMKRTVCGL